MTVKERPISERLTRLKESLIEKSPPVDTERLKFLLEVYREAEGEAAVMKRAKLFDRLLSEKTIYIDENPIVGTETRYRGGISPYPESSCRWMRKEAEFFFHLGGASFTKEDLRLVNEAVDYWENRCVYTKTREAMTHAHKDRVEGIQLAKTGVYFDALVGEPIGETTMNYEKILNKGFNGVIAEIEEEKAKLPLGNFEAHEKRQFYDAALICLNAVIKFARRYASLAREMAQKEADPKRKKELKRIAERCEWIPANPARDFYEAIQSYWLAHVAAFIESPGVAIAPGRFSQYMYPFYQRDKEQEKITEEEAIELLGFLFIKHLEYGLFRAGVAFGGNSGQTSQCITIGGLTPDGKDATNELDWLLLETQRRMRCIQPALAIMYHDKLSDELLLKALEVVRDTGLGQPQFINNSIAIQRLFHQYPGITLEDARDCYNLGCVATRPAHRIQPLGAGLLNMAKMLELALNNGIDPRTGVQIGPETGDAKAFQSYQELFETVRKQLKYLLPWVWEFENMGNIFHGEIVPLPYRSTFNDDCIRRGKDIQQGGARYGGLGLVVVGTIDLANSLAAIKKLVFDEKRITMKALKEALKWDFEGYEDIRQMCLEAPKYGNDDDYADSIARECFNILEEEHRKYRDHLGRTNIPEAQSDSVHNWFGSQTGALPSGRKAWIALTDASVSASPGTDRKGPTALAMSAARVIDTIRYGSNHLNMKFHPSALERREGLRKLLALIKTYMDLGGYHVQFNCVSGETLKDAQLHPESYRDLVIRVAGFSAFFIHLDKGVQDEIIKRTELKFG